MFGLILFTIYNETNIVKMMERLSKLEAKKLMRELDYLLSDLEYKNEVISEAEGKFIGSVNEFLSHHPELKDAFESTLNQRMERSIRMAEQLASEGRPDVQVDEDRPEQNPKVKKLYREIAKLTHPDKVDDARLNDIYLDAGKSYKKEDIIGLYGVCDRLGIDYEVGEDDLDVIRQQIENAKTHIGFLESTTPWVWNFTEEESVRREIVVRYIGSQIR